MLMYKDKNGSLHLPEYVTTNRGEPKLISTLEIVELIQVSFCEKVKPKVSNFNIDCKKFINKNTGNKYYDEQVVFRDGAYRLILANSIIVIPITPKKIHNKLETDNSEELLRKGDITVEEYENLNNIGVDNIESKRGEGIRYNKQKTPYECIPLHLISGAARVFKHVTERPEKSYPMWNWARGMKWSIPYACILRHLDAWYRGETNDSETNENHLHHVLCNLLMLLHYEDAFVEGDDRPIEFFKSGGMSKTER